MGVKDGQAMATDRQECGRLCWKPRSTTDCSAGGRGGGEEEEENTVMRLVTRF
jgi:hypothetical protein